MALVDARLRVKNLPDSVREDLNKWGWEDQMSLAASEILSEFCESNGLFGWADDIWALMAATQDEDKQD